MISEECNRMLQYNITPTFIYVINFNFNFNSLVFQMQSFQKISSLPPGIKTDSGAHPASYPMDTGCNFPGVGEGGGERSGREADHSLHLMPS
jgi:hypothetical protein